MGGRSGNDSRPGRSARGRALDARPAVRDRTVGSAVARRDDRVTLRGRRGRGVDSNSPGHAGGSGDGAANRVVLGAVMLVSVTMRDALVAFLVLLGGAPMAGNWPQWRGPAGHGVSA